ncbi:MAG: response regulator [Spirochaetaceae bacterium]
MKTIFAVDDSVTLRASLNYTLTKAGYDVKLAEDGVIALDKISNYTDKIDCFLFDINMPNMDGITLIKKVREISRFKFTPILFLTTESQESKKMEGKAAGASGWIIKPFDPLTLISTLKKFD